METNINHNTKQSIHIFTASFTAPTFASWRPRPSKNSTPYLYWYPCRLHADYIRRQTNINLHGNEYESQHKAVPSHIHCRFHWFHPTIQPSKHVKRSNQKQYTNHIYILTCCDTTPWDPKPRFACIPQNINNTPFVHWNQFRLHTAWIWRHHPNVNLNRNKYKSQHKARVLHIYHKFP